MQLAGVLWIAGMHSRGHERGLEPGGVDDVAPRPVSGRGDPERTQPAVAPTSIAVRVACHQKSTRSV